MRRKIRLRREEVVSLRNAKAKLSSLTKQANGGMRVVITNHGMPIADLVQHGAEAISLRRLKRPGPLPKPIKPKGKCPTASALILADREG